MTSRQIDSKGKAHRSCEFGLKVSIATPLRRCRGGQFVAHVAALPGNPYDGHTLATVLPAISPPDRHRADPRHHRCRLSRSQRAAHTGILRLYIRTEAWRHRPDQARAVPPARGGAGDRPSQERPPHGAQLPRRAMPPMPCSPLSATTSGSCWSGWQGWCGRLAQSLSAPTMPHPTHVTLADQITSRTTIIRLQAPEFTWLTPHLCRPTAEPNRQFARHPTSL